MGVFSCNSNTKYRSNLIAVRFLSYATRTVFLNEKGEIVERGAAETKSELGALLSDVPSEQHEQVSGLLPTKEKQMNDEPENAEPEAAAPISAKLENTGTDDAESSEERCRKTDLTVFKFYFRFINWRRATIFIVFQTCLAFLSSFPGKRRYQWWVSSFAKFFFLLVTVIWLKWWTDENPDFRDSRTSYYIGVYAALQGAALVASALVTWLVKPRQHKIL